MIPPQGHWCNINEPAGGVPALNGKALGTPGLAMVIHKGIRTIQKLDEWFDLAGPKRASQWKDNRSAKETARLWLASTTLPPEIAAVCASHADFGIPFCWQAEPEVRLRFDSFRGEPRNTDLLVLAEDHHGVYSIAVEAKADEEFGQSARGARKSASRRLLANPDSKGVVRIDNLVSSLMGPSNIGDPEIESLRYQLFGHDRAVFLVHEFLTTATRDNRHARNALDLDRFVGALSKGKISSISPGQLEGPFVVPGTPLFLKIPRLYIGKATRNLRAAGV